MCSTPGASAPGQPGSAGPCPPDRPPAACGSSGCRDRCRGSTAGRAQRTLPGTPGRSKPCLLPRSGTLSSFLIAGAVASKANGGKKTRKAKKSAIGIGVGLAASPSHATVLTGPYTAVRQIMRTPVPAGGAAAGVWNCASARKLRSLRRRAVGLHLSGWRPRAQCRRSRTLLSDCASDSRTRARVESVQY
jgi:hypothetical protein